MSHKTLEQDLIAQLTILNDLRLENKIDRAGYAVELSKIIKVADLFGVKLFDKESN